MTLGQCSAQVLQLPPTLQKPVTPGSLSQPSLQRGILSLPFRRRTTEMWTSFLLCRPGISQPTVSILISFYGSVSFVARSTESFGRINVGLFKISKMSRLHGLSSLKTVISPVIVSSLSKWLYTTLRLLLLTFVLILGHPFFSLVSLSTFLCILCCNNRFSFYNLCPWCSVVVTLSLFFYPQQIALEMKVNKINLFITVDIDAMNLYIFLFFFFHLDMSIGECLDISWITVFYCLREN